MIDKMIPGNSITISRALFETDFQYYGLFLLYRISIEYGMNTGYRLE